MGQGKYTKDLGSRASDSGLADILRSTEPITSRNGKPFDPWDVKEALKAYTTHLNKKKLELHNGSAHITPSAIASDMGSCARYLGYLSIGEPKEYVHKPTGMYLFGVIGSAVHDFFQSALAFYHGDKADFEVRAYDGEIHLSGRGDGEWTNGSVIYGLEIKSVGSKALLKIKQSGVPRREDEKQVQPYFSIRGWSKCVFVYVDRQGLQPTDWVDMAIIISGPNKPMYSAIRQFIINDVLAVIERGEVPLPSRGSYCPNCYFRSACIKDKFGE